MAQTQQIFVKALRQIELAPDHVIERLPKGKVKELRGRTQLLPQLLCTGIDMSRFRCGEAFDGDQDGAQGTVKFKLLPLVRNPAPASNPHRPTPPALGEGQRVHAHLDSY